MKLLTVSHLFPNPAEPFNGVFVAELVSALSQKVESQVVAPVSHFPVLRPSKQVPFQENASGSTVYHPRYLALPGPLLNHRWKPFHSSIQKIMESSGFLPDVVHAHWLYPDGFATDRWAKAQGIPTVVTIHGLASLGTGVLGRETPRCREALHSIDRIIAVSQEIREFLVRDFEIPEKKIRVIHNGFDPAKFPFLSREDSRRALGLALNRRIAICVARLSEEKRIDLLVEAVAKCRTPGLQVFVIGTGPLRNDLLALIDKEGMQNRIVLTGGIRHEELSNWYHAADLFCLSSAEEGCPVVVHEALGCGLPVVSTPVGAVPDMIHTGETGILADGEAGALARAIDEGLERTWDRDLVVRKGRQYTWETVAQKTIEVYRELISDH